MINQIEADFFMEIFLLKIKGAHVDFGSKIAAVRVSLVLNPEAFDALVWITPDYL